jgi:hypothetical protein
MLQSHYGTSHPEVFSKFARDLTKGLSSSVNKVIAEPEFPALPVLPTRCIYVSIELGKS